MANFWSWAQSEGKIYKIGTKAKKLAKQSAKRRRKSKNIYTRLRDQRQQDRKMIWNCLKVEESPFLISLNKWTETRILTPKQREVLIQINKGVALSSPVHQSAFELGSQNGDQKNKLRAKRSDDLEGARRL